MRFSTEYDRTVRLHFPSPLDGAFCKTGGCWQETPLWCRALTSGYSRDLLLTARGSLVMVPPLFSPYSCDTSACGFPVAPDGAFGWEAVPGAGRAPGR